MPYLDIDTVLMTKPLYDFCNSVRESNDVSTNFWSQFDCSFLRSIPDTKLRFVSDNCPEFTDTTVKWEPLEGDLRRYTLLFHYDSVDPNSEVANDKHGQLRALRQLGVTAASFVQDVDLSGDEPVGVLGSCKIEYLPEFKDLVKQRYLRSLENSINSRLRSLEANVESSRGLEFDVVIGFIAVQFLLKYGSDSFDVEERVVEKKPHHKKQAKKAGGVPVVRTYRTYRLVKDFDFSDKNPIMRQCRLWLVRSHDRHYKDGRVVHIEAYYKGIDRETVDKDNPPPSGRIIKAKPLHLGE